MTLPCRRIAMWSGPRNISTTMMRSFSSRPDTHVIDEPLYAHYLSSTGVTHPMQEEILASHPTGWREVVEDLSSGCPAQIYFQKHMCHHLTQEIDKAWMGSLDHFFLIRDPALMVASYARKMDKVSPEALGLDQELQIFEEVSALQGRTAPVIDAMDVLQDPEGMLRKLCEALDIPFYSEMLSWPPGRHPQDGVWGEHWYQNIWASTGFVIPKPHDIVLNPDLQSIVEATLPAYDALKQYALK